MFTWNDIPVYSGNNFSVDNAPLQTLLSALHSQKGAILQRFSQVIRLSPQDEADYIRCHEQVWPEVLRTIAACNIANYSIFLRNGLLFAYFEYHGNDYPADLLKMAECPHTQRWWKMTDAMQIPMADAAPGEKWSPLREVFHFDSVRTDIAHITKA